MAWVETQDAPFDLNRRDPRHPCLVLGSQSYVQCLSALTLSAIFHGLRHLYARQQRKEAEQEASAPSKEDKEVDATPRA